MLLFIILKAIVLGTQKGLRLEMDSLMRRDCKLRFLNVLRAVVEWQVWELSVISKGKYIGAGGKKETVVTFYYSGSKNSTDTDLFEK